MFERFTDRARRVVVLAQEEARMLNHNYIGTEHILLGLIHEGEGVAAKALESLGISLEAVRQQVEEIIGEGKQAPSGHIPFTPRAKKVLEFSLREAIELQNNYVGTEHILLGLIREGEGVAAQLLIKLGADLPRTRARVVQIVGANHVKKPTSSDGLSELAPSSGAPSPSASAPSTSLVLDQFGRSLTQTAREGRLDPVIGREKEIERVMQVLSRRTKNIAVLVGEPGVGKTAVVEGLAQKIVWGEVPAILENKQLYALDPRRLVSGVSNNEGLEERLREILDELTDRDDIILFFDDLQELVGEHAMQGPVNGGMIVKLMLTRSDLRIISAITLDEYDNSLKNDSMLERSLQPVHVTEPTISDTIEILKVLRDRYENHHQVSITDAALVAAAELADSSWPSRVLPVKAIDVIDEAGAQAQVRRMTRHPDLREYDVKIAQARREKESAIDSQDFEKAVALRDKERQIMAARDTREKERQDGGIDIVVEVNEEHIAETIAIMSGASSPMKPAAVTRGSRKPPFMPASMTDDDREIWAMA
jgi:ATP-dependent Clp protease ATP-binding subunit ClpC